MCHCRCACGSEIVVRYSDLRLGTSSCRPCAAKDRGALYADRAKDPSRLEELRKRAKNGGQKAAALTTKWRGGQRRLVNILASAIQRCSNPNNDAYQNYGGRGIRFEFESLEAAVRWVEANIGLPPQGMSIDRVDNDGNYAPGNLRWATRTTQANNKRTYKNAHRWFKEAAEARPDLSKSLVRSLLKRGKTLDDIKGWVKYESSRV